MKPEIVRVGWTMIVWIPRAWLVRLWNRSDELTRSIMRSMSSGLNAAMGQACVEDSIVFNHERAYYHTT